jgi:hypothetical protein
MTPKAHVIFMKVIGYYISAVEQNGCLKGTAASKHERYDRRTLACLSWEILLTRGVGRTLYL